MIFTPVHREKKIPNANLLLVVDLSSDNLTKVTSIPLQTEFDEQLCVNVLAASAFTPELGDIDFIVYSQGYDATHVHGDETAWTPGRRGLLLDALHLTNDHVLYEIAPP
jgi:hypothetical protein